MNISVVGLFSGLLLAIAASTGGWLGFLLAVVFGVLGLAIGAHLEGQLDLSALVHGRGHG